MIGIYIKLVFTALLPALVSGGLYIAERKTSFGKIKYSVRQIIFGCIFGGLAILGTEFGIAIDGAIINVRDSAPLCAGLIFGAPAGILAGVIGGVERYIAVFWGVGSYTQIACTVATICSGIFGAVLRKFLFGNKIPAWYYGLTAGIIAEVLHMLMVYVTNLDDVRRAFTVVAQCAPIMIPMNGFAVMLALVVVTFLGKEKLHLSREQTKIAQSFQRWLLVCVLVAFFFTSLFTYVLESKVSSSETDNLISLNIADVQHDIIDASDSHLLEITQNIAIELNVPGEITQERLVTLQKRYRVSEINYVDENGIIAETTNAIFMDFDMASGEQSNAFMVLLRPDTYSFVQAYQPVSYDNTISRKYAGVKLMRGGFVQVGYDADYFQRDVAQRVNGITRNRHVGENGFVLICDKDGIICSDRNGHERQSLMDTDIDLRSIPEGIRIEMNVFGEDCYLSYLTSEGYYIIGVLPVSEAVFSRNMSVYTTIFMEVLVFAALFFIISLLIKRLIVDNIRKITGALSEITGGNLNTVVNVRTNQEFASLSDDINSTVVTLKNYIDEAAARIDQELEFARQIQSSSIPRVFPPFPGLTEFDIWASMNTAKEVGGDFYDFYFAGKETFAFVIADVSGKGIPAAMFMMTAKTLIKNFAESGISPGDVFTNANEELCANNDAGMFVTAWMGVLNIRTGLVTFANAGHNPPLIRHGDGTFEYLKSRPGFVLAGMEGMRYRNNEVQLQPGDTIYLYTDGVTEATDAENELFGEDRLQNTLNKVESRSAETLCKAVTAAVEDFVGDAPQFDDITMLGLTYNMYYDPEYRKEQTE